MALKVLLLTLLALGTVQGGYLGRRRLIPGRSFGRSLRNRNYGNRGYGPGSYYSARNQPRILAEHEVVYENVRPVVKPAPRILAEHEVVYDPPLPKYDEDLGLQHLNRAVVQEKHYSDNYGYSDNNAVTNEYYDAPVVTKTYDAPVVTKTYDAPVVANEYYDAPVVANEYYEEPVATNEYYEEPVATNEYYEEPVATNEYYEAPLAPVSAPVVHESHSRHVSQVGPGRHVVTEEHAHVAPDGHVTRQLTRQLTQRVAPVLKKPKERVLRVTHRLVDKPHPHTKIAYNRRVSHGYRHHY